MIELYCKHKVGHSEEIHGCDGCCAGIAKAVEQRIIKLLEDPATMNAWWGMPDKNIGIYGNLAKYLIAKIRPEGENK